MTQQEVAVRPTQELKTQVERMAPEYAAALPPQVPVERFMRVVLTAVNGNPDLMAADRRSLFEASMKAAQDGLLPDGRDGALVVFNTKSRDGGWTKKVQWMPMIAGVLKKVRNSGELSTIAAHVVHENDRFVYILGDDEKIEHEPVMGNRGKVIAAYAIAKTKDGGIYREVMDVTEIERVRGVSRAKDSGPWKDWWSEMARKTVLRRLAKRLPMSTDLDDLIRRDDELYDLSGKNPELAGAHTALFKPVANPLSDEEPETIAGNGADEAPGAASPQPSQDSAAASGALQSDTAEKVVDHDPTSAPTEAAGEALQSEKSSDPDPYTKGREARRKGMKRSVVPGEYRADDDEARENLRLYREGWDGEDSNL